MDDKELVRKVLGGDNSCYSEIVKRHTPAVFSATLRLMRDKDMAAELTQQAFVRAFERLCYFHSSNLREWLLVIAYHLCINAQTKQNRHRTIRDYRMAETVAYEPYSEERERMIMQMETAIDNLPGDDRDIIRMHYYEQISTKDIAERKGLSQSNVLVKLSRIREKLRNTIRYERD